jgi:hypothetical protein
VSRWYWVLSVVCLTVCGCGGSDGPTGTINGKLTHKGKPVAEGTMVNFLSSVGAVSGATGADGTFSIEEAPVGKYAVCVTASPAANAELQDPAKAMKKAMDGKFKKMVGADTTIPAKYQSSDKSGVSFEVKEGENSFSLDMN